MTSGITVAFDPEAATLITRNRPSFRARAATQQIDPDQSQQRHQAAAEVLCRAAPEIVDQALGGQADVRVGVHRAADAGDCYGERARPVGPRRDRSVSAKINAQPASSNGIQPML